MRTLLHPSNIRWIFAYQGFAIDLLSVINMSSPLNKLMMSGKYPFKLPRGCVKTLILRIFLGFLWQISNLPPLCIVLYLICHILKSLEPDSALQEQAYKPDEKSAKVFVVDTVINVIPTDIRRPLLIKLSFSFLDNGFRRSTCEDCSTFSLILSAGQALFLQAQDIKNCN